uniref:F-box domain-containing protein n=1 Tax=Oryza punctata TaxID=4537 RepID=A0A0E0KI35_ORYPU
MVHVHDAAPCHLNIDVLLHVFFRLDPISIVRCAAVSKLWRRAVIDNASQVRRHPDRQSDRRLLLGFHYREVYPSILHFCARSTWLPDGLLVVSRGILEEISVYNPFTGFHAVVPRFDEIVTGAHFLHSVLAVEIEYNGVLALQNYSSGTGAWGPVIRPNPIEVLMPRVIRHSVAAIECQGAIHWLCGKTSRKDEQRRSLEQWDSITHIVAVDLSTGGAWTTRLPKQCTMYSLSVVSKKMLMLATAEDGRLALLRREDAGTKVTIGCTLKMTTAVAVVAATTARRAGFYHDVSSVRKLVEDARTHVWSYEMDLTVCYSSLKQLY